MTKKFFLAIAAMAMAASWSAISPVAAQDGDVTGEAPVKETFGDWEQRCAEDGRCYIFQQAVNEDGNPLLRVRIAKLAQPLDDGQGAQVIARADIITPLDVFLPNGVGLRIDDGPIQTAVFVRCRPIGCVARPPLTNQLIDAMKSGGEATFVLFQDPQDGPVLAPISLSGFTAAIDSL
ncbi:MAG: invasion associated locus B family protein [Pseudomonadota bacterium]